MKIRFFLFPVQAYALFLFLFLILVNPGCGSRKLVRSSPGPELAKTLLWRVSGQGMEQPSYLFGTIHALCKEDALLSDSLKSAIARAQDVYLELDMDNVVEMMGAMSKMKMRSDTTLSDLLEPQQYQAVKAYFKKNGSLLPFSMIETYKPFLAASTLMQNNLPCSQSTAMEQEIMSEARRKKKKINGLETMAYQMSIFDSIPYKQQADLLYRFIQADTGQVSSGKDDYQRIVDTYKSQDLEKLEALTKEDDIGIGNYEDLLLYNRNRNWVAKLKTLLKNKVMVIAVGAGHLPGEQGLIQLLRKAGYTVEPVENKVPYKNSPVQEI